MAIADEKNTRPAPAATDTGLVTVGYGYMNSLGELEYAHATSSEMRTEALCRRSQAEELLAAEREKNAKLQKYADSQRERVREELEEGSRLRSKLEALEAKLAAAEKALERIKNMSREDGPWDQIAYDMQQIAARAVLGGEQ